MNALTLSSGSILIKFWIALPLESLLPSGISKTLIQKHLPFCVKNSMYWWLVPTNKYSRKSSLRVVDPFWPTPPLCWVLYSAKAVLLIYPAWEMVKTTFSSGIMSSMLNSPPENSITDLLSSPCFSFISRSSSFMIVILLSLSFKISFRSFISSTKLSYSSLNLSCSRPVSCLNLISTIAFDWISDNLNSVIKFFLASSALEDFLIISITLSILSDAIIRPSRIWALSSAFFRSNLVRLTTTSCLWSTKYLIISFRLRSFGLPLTRAMLLTLKEDCKAVYLYKVFKTIFGIASLLRI